MASNFLSPVEKMSSEHLATARQKLEYLYSMKNQLGKMVEKILKAFTEIEKDKYHQHFLHDIKRVVCNTVSALEDIVDTELLKVFGNGFDVRTNRFDEDMTDALLDGEKTRKYLTFWIPENEKVSALEELFGIMAHTNMLLTDILGFVDCPSD
ncbi:hypothetical protein TNCV_3701201 [Trichonephila clavipes]|nr:hypothetical protein TNCV_3701201 [Trichonephila clavipes]